MQIWAESGKSALPICNYSQILYQFLTFTQNLKRSLIIFFYGHGIDPGWAWQVRAGSVIMDSVSYFKISAGRHVGDIF